MDLASASEDASIDMPKLEEAKNREREIQSKKAWYERKYVEEPEECRNMLLHQQALRREKKQKHMENESRKRKKEVETSDSYDNTWRGGWRSCIGAPQMPRDMPGYREEEKETSASTRAVRAEGVGRTW